MAAHYVVHRYLAECGLPHEPYGRSYLFDLAYDDIELMSIEPMFIKLALENRLIEDFQVLITRLIPEEILEENRTRIALVTVALCARILTLQNKPELIPQFISITDTLTEQDHAHSSDRSE